MANKANMAATDTSDAAPVNRTYKSTLFIMLFQDKNNLLELYNAVSGKHNRKLKEACRTLREYAIYTDKVRKYVEAMELADAVERAIQECIAGGVLKDFLEKHRAEAKEMSIFEYDQEKHMLQEREEAWADGHSAGLKEGRAAGLEEARLSMIIQMLKNAMSEEDISRVAGVSQDEIKKAKEMDI